jgi:hypothetical protein
MLAGQVIVGCTGGRVSTTVTVNVQEVPPLAHTTAVVPIGNEALDGGLQTTAGVWPVSELAQFPEVVGVE